MIVEDQYGVGDLVDVGPVTGTVEEVALRVTRIRDLTGVVWYVRNGEILRVANQSQGWTMAAAVIPVSYNADLEEIRQVVIEVGNDMYNDPETRDRMLGRPTFAGVEAVSGEAIYVRIVVKARASPAGAAHPRAARAAQGRLRRARGGGAGAGPADELHPTGRPAPGRPAPGGWRRAPVGRPQDARAATTGCAGTGTGTLAPWTPPRAGCASSPVPPATSAVRLVPELLAAGHRVRVLARHPDRLRDLPWHDDVDVAVGDAADPVALPAR